MLGLKRKLFQYKFHIRVCDRLMDDRVRITRGILLLLFLTSPLKPGLVFVDPLIGSVAQRGLPRASSNCWKPDVACVLRASSRDSSFSLSI